MANSTGGNAFVAGAANDSTGQVGVIVNGTFPNSASVTLALPAYADLLAKTATINSVDAM